MNVAFFIGHPSHVHLFKNAIMELDREGHHTKVIARNKDITLDLLNNIGIDYVKSTQNSEGPLRSIRHLFGTYYYGYNNLKEFDPDVLVSRFNPAVPHLAKIYSAKCLMFELNEKRELLANFAAFFTDCICTPESFTQDRGKIHQRYRGFHEMAYLHPNWFSPDPEILEKYGICAEDDYFVVRYVSWDAYHDIGHNGLTKEERQEVINMLSKRGRVFLSTEDDINYVNAEPVPTESHEIHHLLSFADLYLGESGTMPIEAGLLGTPSICINPLIDDWGIFNELVDDYELIKQIHPRDISSLDNLINNIDKKKLEVRRKEVLNDKIDLTRYIVQKIYELHNHKGTY